MANAKYDENGRATIICASTTDGTTVVQIKANPTSHALNVIDGSSQTDNGNNEGNAMEDENSVAVWTALSSAGNGNIVEIYGDSSTGSVLVKMM